MDSVGRGAAQIVWSATMPSNLLSFAKSGVIALAAVASLPVYAAPIGPTIIRATAEWNGGSRHWDGQNLNGRPVYVDDDEGDDEYNGDDDYDYRPRRHYRYYNDYYDNNEYNDNYYEPVYPRRYYHRAYRYRSDGGSSHTQWCYARYRSYRAWDDTYQPY